MPITLSPAKNVTSLAETLGLTTLKTGGPFGAPAAIGRIDGFPVAAAWTQINKQSTVAILVRFKNGSLREEAGALAERIATLPDLLAAISKKKLSTVERKTLQVGLDFVRVNLHYVMRAYSPEAVAGALRALVATIKSAAAPVGTVCESCSSTSGELYCVDGVPTSICAGCRERSVEESRHKVEEYAAKEPNIFLGTAAGVGACLVMAILWGGVAYAIERIFLYGAFLIGLAIAWSVNRAMGKVNAYGRVLTVALTLGAVLLGDYIFILLSAAREWGESVSVDLARVVAEQFPAVEFSSGSSGWMSLFFGVVGAGLILWANRPPVLQRQMVPVGPAAH